MHFFLRCLLSSDYIWTPFAIAFADDSFQRLTCCQDAFFVGVQGIARTSSEDPPSHLSPGPVSFQGIGIFLPIELFLYQVVLAAQAVPFADYHDPALIIHSCLHSLARSLRATS